MRIQRLIYYANATLFLIVLAGCQFVASMPGQDIVGMPLPVLEAEGWVNGEAPTAEQLDGKVVVIDAWAFWCGPCAAIAPDLVATSEKFSGQDVQFIGLTEEPAAKLAETKAAIASHGIPWPNGYGALATLERLQVTGLPTVMVFDRTGKLSWIASGAPLRGLDEAIETALAAE